MGYYQLSKEDMGKLLDQQVHMVVTIQEHRHSTRNFERVAREYLCMDGTLFQAMATLPCHIDRFEQQYDKEFAADRLFGANIVGRTHKWVQIFLHLCKTTSLDDVETGVLLGLGGLQRQVEWGKFITTPRPPRLGVAAGTEE